MANLNAPFVMVIGGVNGAGKTTIAQALLQGSLDLSNFLNADLIAKGLSPFDPALADLAAGEILLKRIDDFAAQRASFGLESTLSGKTLASRLKLLRELGYEVHLIYVFLRNVDLAITRVARRILLGGHPVDETTIRRRYNASLRNFFKLYRVLATSWQFVDNSEYGEPTCVANGAFDKVLQVHVPRTWRLLESQFAEKPRGPKKAD